MHLFAYGTLMFPEVWARVVGRVFETRPAFVDGFAVYRVRSGVFPAMLEARPEQRVAGLIYLDLDGAALAALDEYESELYDRLTITATLAEGRALACEAYVLPASRRQMASNEPWDAEHFRREQLARYVNENT
jgi:gamma-glutamylcyclotransferase (GGCT)/AIG2-like uncharacterized protein YtfP